MTNPTPQDREMADNLSLRFWLGPEAGDTLLQAIATARLQGRREALEEAARVAEGFAFASWPPPVANSRQIATAIRKLGEA